MKNIYELSKPSVSKKKLYSIFFVTRYEIKEMIQKIKLVQESAVSASTQTVKSDGADKISVKNNGAIIAQQPNSKGIYP